ncbi:hypothetical protein [Candidatus Contubernalis alkaliaceticus]|uniref:hypothetical protein n=1 Tax=Candidatus Contubernalis alkaliaceticus TaxID=338645 RepID=UPI001F4C51A2|nr:hypothetical protein [Candidatus Contubernalis alkalaceticus]UNC91702.1 hypothetical protein HUE98_06105 [Candidatus Contubernalis alkalaceticus]
MSLTPLLRQIVTDAVENIRRFRVAITKPDGTEIFTETDPGHMQLMGNIPEYGPWLHSDPEPTPDFDRALGIRVNADHTLTVLYWNGTAWVEVV